MTRHVGALCVAGLVLLPAVPARAATPTDTLREFFARVNGVIQAPAEHMTLDERVRLIRRLTHTVFDVRRAAADVLGPEWPARTPAEQRRFARLFGDVLQRGYLALVGSKAKINGGVDVAFIDEAVSGNVAVVRTTVATRRHGEERIDYRMSRAGDRWWIIDTMIGGVSLVGSYRAQFTRMRQRSTYAELVGVMQSIATESPRPEIASAADAVAPDGDATVKAAMLSSPSEAGPTVVMTERPLARAGVAAPASPAGPAVAAVPAPAVAPATAALAALAPPVPANTAPLASPLPMGGTPSPGLSANEPAPPPPSRPVAGGPHRFWVQIGAFRNMDFATRLVERLHDPGVAIFMPPLVARAAAPLTRVCVGPFARRAVAVAKARELEAVGYRAIVTAEEP